MSNNNGYGSGKTGLSKTNSGIEVSGSLPVNNRN
jgi:hypothetical protein